ncbi:hypothetical protein FQA39_LY04183 [Lamprigera yunnana]|nr:hypothetical protein FQA39_LY04183 [Lamprigera yunnana]
MDEIKEMFAKIQKKLSRVEEELDKNIEVIRDLKKENKKKTIKQQDERIKLIEKDMRKNNFWSVQVQEKIRASIYEPRGYNKRFGSYSHNVWYWIEQIQSKIPEEIFMSAVIKHFPYDIETSLTSARVMTVDDLLEVIKQLENRDKYGSRNMRHQEPNRRDEHGPYRSGQRSREFAAPVNQTEWHRRRGYRRERKTYEPRGMEKNVDPWVSEV